MIRQARVFRHIESGIADDDTQGQPFDLIDLKSGRVFSLDAHQSDSGDTCRVQLGFFNQGVGEFFPIDEWLRNNGDFPAHAHWDGDWPVPLEGVTKLRLTVYNASATAVAIFVRMVYGP